MEDIQDTVTLHDLLEGREDWPVDPGSIASELGKLLSTLLAAGVQHPDLHAGNVILDRGGRAHLIDMARVRVGGRAKPAALLSRCAAGIRERAPRRFRARVLASFRRASGLNLDPEDLEANARQKQRALVSRQLARYWRESGAMQLIKRSGVSVLLAKDHEPAKLAELDAGPLPPGFSEQRAGSIGELKARWERAARAQMHRLPCERPVALFRRRSSAHLVMSTSELSPGEQAEPCSLARTLGSIHDRGLQLVGEAKDLGVAAGGVVQITGGRLIKHDRTDRLHWVLRWFTILDIKPSSDTLDAFLAEQRGTTRERERIASAWRADG